MSRALLAVVLIATTASADLSKLPGIRAYQNGDFGTAARELAKAIPTLSGEDRMQALMWLSAAHYASSRIHDTHESLSQLYREFPSAKFDPNVFDPDLVALSKRVEAEERARRVKLEPKEQEHPEEAPPASVVVAEEPAKAGRGPLPYVAAGGAAVALGASIFFVTQASSQKSRLDSSFDSSGQSTLTHPDALALQRGANRDMTFGVASLACTAALSALTVWLFTRDEAP